MFWLTSASRNPFLKEPGRSLRKWITSWQSLLETCSTVPNCIRQKPNSFKPSYFHVTWFLKMWLSYTNNAGWAFCLFTPMSCLLGPSLYSWVTFREDCRILPILFLSCFRYLIIIPCCGRVSLPPSPSLNYPYHYLTADPLFTLDSCYHL